MSTCNEAPKIECLSKDQYTYQISPIRLENGFTKEGRLEIFHGGKWGTICDEKFTQANAIVACRQLGFPSGIFWDSLLLRMYAQRWHLKLINYYQETQYGMVLRTGELGHKVVLFIVVRSFVQRWVYIWSLLTVDCSNNNFTPTKALSKICPIV